MFLVIKMDFLGLGLMNLFLPLSLYVLEWNVHWWSWLETLRLT